MENEIWNEGQLGPVEGVLSTIDQLIIDRCIMEEVKQNHRNLAIAFYDYKKAYDKAHHDWMLRVCGWIGIPSIFNRGSILTSDSKSLVFLNPIQITQILIQVLIW